MYENNTPDKGRDAAASMQKASDSMMSSAGRALDATRDHANNALDKAESKLRELRGNVDPTV